MGAYQRPPYDDFDDDESPGDYIGGDPGVIEGEVIIDYSRSSSRARTSQRPGPARYPMVYEVRYPGMFDRTGAALRPLLAIPLLLFMAPLQVLIVAGFVVGWLAVIATRTYPRWLFDALVAAMSFGARIEAYALLLTDQLPLPNDARSPVALAWADPPDGRLSPWRAGLWKTALLVPHVIMLAALTFAQVIITIISWVAILRTGMHPPDFFAFSTGVNRWRYRVLGYYASFNDRFPPFTHWSGAGPAQSTTVMACAAGGLLLLGAVIGVAIASATGQGLRTQEVSWAALEGRTTFDEGWRFAAGEAGRPAFVVTLVGVMASEGDSGGVSVPLGAQAITFLLNYENRLNGSRTVEDESIIALLAEPRGDQRQVAPAYVTVDGTLAPAVLGPGRSGRVEATFVIPVGTRIAELRLAPPWSAPDVAFAFR